MVGIIIVVFYFIIVLYINDYKKFIYKDYKTIHIEIDPNMSGYEIPIAKSVELLNNRVSDAIAYNKYNFRPEVYKEMQKDLQEDTDALEKNKKAYDDELSYMLKEYGMGYEISYKIISVEKAEVENIEEYIGILDLYDVGFEISLSVEGEEKISEQVERKIARVDEEWFFYDEKFYIINYFLPWDFYYENEE